jgi:demethylmenaquinone methyltransferase/2-methoxy-6-polyprenyl-1,4-benzoquinol methylase
MPEAPKADAPWLAEGRDKREAVQRMFAKIAPSYDLCNSLMSLRMHRRWRAAAVAKLHLKQGDRVADVCCGTGDFFMPLRRAIGADGVLVGVDFCLPMLELANQKDEAAGRAVGDAGCLPLRSESVDAVTVGWGIRNVPDIDLAHREIWRVLKPGGRFVSIDMALPSNSLVRAGSRVMSEKVLPRLGALFGNREAYTYLPKSTERFKTREELKASMEASGFVAVGHQDLFFGNICMHWGTKG